MIKGKETARLRMKMLGGGRKFTTGGQCIEKTKSDACFDDLSDEEDDELMLEDSSSEEEPPKNETTEPPKNETTEPPKNETNHTEPAVCSKKSPTRRSPTKRSLIQVCNPIRNLVNDIFLLREEGNSAEQLSRVWHHFAGEENTICDSDLESLLIDFLILAREAARQQIKRQQKALKHVESYIIKLDSGFSDPPDEDDLSELMENVHERYPAVGSSSLKQVAGSTAVKCNKILARIKRGSSFIRPFKEILDPGDGDIITQELFMSNFPKLLKVLCDETNLESLGNLAPIRHASSGENLNWRPNALPVGDITIHVEFNFEDLELPDTEDFNIPSGVTVRVFIDHLCVVYPDIEEYKEDLEIQIVTPDRIKTVMFDDDTIMEHDYELVLLD